MEAAEHRIQSALGAAHRSSTVASAATAIVAYEEWQTQLATWLHTLARTHAPNSSLPPLDALRPSAHSCFPVDALILHSSSVDASSPIPPQLTSRRRTLTRPSDEPSTVAAVTATSATSTDARIKPASYALRPFSARLQPVAEPTFSRVHGAAAPPSSSRFPTLMQLNAPSELAAPTSVAPLPTAATAPISPAVIAAAASFTPLAALSTPSPPSVAKSSHRYQPPDLPPSSARTFAADAVRDLVGVIQEHQARTQALEAQLHTLQQARSSPPVVVELPITLPDTSAVASPASTPVSARAPPTLAPVISAAVAPALTAPSVSAPRVASATVPLAARPAFVVSTSSPHAPLSLGVTLAAASKAAAPSAETYQARIARESEARRVAKEAERAATLAAAQAAAALEAERERKRREAAKVALAAQKKEREERERAKWEADLATAKQAKLKEKEAQAKRATLKEEAERAKKAKEDEEAAAAAAALAAAAAERKQKRASTATAPVVVVEPTPAVPATTAAPDVPPTSSTVSSPPTQVTVDSPSKGASKVVPRKTKAAAAKAATVEWGCQTEPQEPDEGSVAAYISKRYQVSPEEQAEDAADQAELAALNVKDQLAKLALDLRYSRIRIRGLDEETRSQLSRIQEQKAELAKQAWIVRTQNQELQEFRAEASKMVSTGLPDEEKPRVTDQSADTPVIDLSKSIAAVSSVTTNPLVSVQPPPSLSAALARDPACLAWLRALFDQLQLLDNRRREAERITAETVHHGRQAELNLLEVWKENERLQKQMQAIHKAHVNA